MRLKGKLALLLLALTLLFLIINWAIHTYVIMPGFLEVERDQAIESIKRTDTALNRDIAALDGICTDWAAWDDAYQFITDHNSAFSKSNLVEETFPNNHLNLLLFYDLAGNYVAGNTYDLITGKFIDLPDFPRNKLPHSNSLFRKLPAQAAVSGIISTSKGPMLLSAQVIRRSNNSGPPKGFLLMGYFLDNREIASLGQQILQNLTITPVANLSGPESAIYNSLTPANDFIQLVADHQVMHAYTAFADLEGAPAMLIKVDLPRDVFKHGLQTMRLSLAITFVAWFLVMLLLLYLTHTKIVRPSGILLDQITSIRQKETLQPFTVPKGTAEIDIVVAEFNTLITQLTAKEMEQEDARKRTGEVDPGTTGGDSERQAAEWLAAHLRFLQEDSR
ncbi:MAG: hypothetical protein HGA96_04900 [Desulfobulbaceae bacterium]|nr:hypothetical protein [Desulfobulbaceae bacterium]